MKIFTSVFLASLTLLLSLASPVFALDATQAVRLNVTPKSPIPTGTVATWPLDASVPPGWLACNGQAVPSAYPELRALMGSVPNYNSQQFLRGSTSGAGRTVADSTRSHTHGQPSHTHSVNGQLVSGTLSGRTAPQPYQDWGTVTQFGPTASGYVTWVSITGGDGVSIDTGRGYFYVVDNKPTLPSISVSGNLNNTSVTGTANQSGGDETYATGGIETAPKHTLVKFIIKHD